MSGIAVTDTPASINTTRLQFSMGEAIHMGNAEALNFTLQPDDEQASATSSPASSHLTITNREFTKP
ncbi:hypothetical protein [Escherichia coli]|uniref:hypothetical protein n=1 Tax=Escherichia coli TaxID=562 RepID=UPI002FCD3A64